MMPLYLPAFDGGNAPARQMPVFFGGINVYLQQHVPLFRWTPRWLDKLFDSRWMLKLAARQEGSTNAATLGPMTLSMLEGRHGYQKKEYERLIAWLVEHEKPDVIHISNALLLGLATEIRRTLDVPIVCSLQDEEPWVDAMHAPWNQRCWDAIAECARHVDSFIATSEWYADRMSERMKIARDRISVVYLGCEVGDEEPPGPAFDPPTIGFLSRVAEAQGFQAIVDAFIRLKQEEALKHLRLRATGGCTEADRPFIAAIRNQLQKHGFEDAVDFVPDFQDEHRRAFLRSLTLLSTPAPEGEAFGIQLVEAMAAGIPVVQPAIGAYPEIVNATGGGVLYDPANPDALVNALRDLLCNLDKARTLGRQGRAAVRERFSIQRVARDMAAQYEDVVSRTRR
jgi:glycosyltransferase involved in cell wall biosynthesis